MNDYIALIKIFAGDFAPVGWAFCNGQLLSVSDYSTVFALIGTTYGGDGINNFALPDLRGRVCIGAGQGNGLSNYVLGQKGGLESITLSVNNLPAHNHTVSGTITPLASSDVGTTTNPTGVVAAHTGARKNFSTTSNTTRDTATLANSGNSLPFSITQPTLCISFIIYLEGIFPSRN